MKKNLKKRSKGPITANIGIVALAASFLLVNVGLVGAVIGVQQSGTSNQTNTVATTSETSTTQELTVGLLQPMFEKELKEAGLSYQEAHYFKVGQQQNGNFYFDVSPITDGLIGSKIRANLGKVKGIFSSLPGIETKIDSAKVDTTIAETNTAITALLGAPNSELELQLLHFADVDGGGDIYENVKNFSALVTKFKRDYPNTLLLSSGDNWIPGPEYDIAEDTSPEVEAELGIPGAGRGHIKILNDMGVQASALGNHEFDRGPGAVADVIKEEVDSNDPTKKWDGASFPYLATNLDFSALAGAGGDFEGVQVAGGQKATDLKNKITSYTILETGGQKVGVVGAVSNALEVISSLGEVKVTTSSMTALVTEIQKDVDALKAQGINKIILLAHMQQLSIEKALAPLLDGVDIIVAGGSNSLIADANDVLSAGDAKVDDYPLTFTGKDGGTTLVVNTAGDFEYLGRLVLKFDSNGFIMPNTLDNAINGVYRSDFDIANNNFGVVAADINPAVAKTADVLREKVIAKKGVIFGRTSVYLNGEREFVRTQETNYGNLTADANLWYAKKADPEVIISFKNGGGIRGPVGVCVLPSGSVDPKDLVCSPPKADPAVMGSVDGGISQLDIETSLRFNNGLSVVTLTPAGIKALVENGLARADIADGVVSQTGSFPQIAGMVVEYDLSKTSSSRITKITLNDANTTEVGNQPLVIVDNGVVVATEAAKTFKLVSLDYVLRANTDPSKKELKDEAVGTLPANNLFSYGGEQAAIAEYLKAVHGTEATAFNLPDNRFDSTHVDSRLVNKTPDAPVAVARKVYGYTDVYINGSRNDLTARETNLADLFTDAHVAYAKKFDPAVNIAIENPAGIRISQGELGACNNGVCTPPAADPNTMGSVVGEITDGAIEKIANFDNGLYIVELTSEQLVNVLKDDIRDGSANVLVSGVVMEIDFTVPAGQENLRKVTVIDSDPNTDGNQNLVIWENGALVTAAATNSFKIVTNSFIATAASYPIASLNLEASKLVNLRTAANPPAGLNSDYAVGTSRDSLVEYFAENYDTKAKAYKVVDTEGDTSVFVPTRILITK